MVIKGGSRSGAAGLAAHLLRTDTNERSEVLELHGVLADRLPDALLEMEAVATGTKCRKSFYHASINTGPGEELTLEQKAAAVARLELALGLEGHARAVVEHRKEGRDHLHVVWSRIDVDTMKAVHDGHNYRKHEQVARELEREFGHNRVQGAHHERDGPEGERQPRPPRTPSPGDVQQATRTKRQLGDVGAELTRLWRAADTGPAFAAALDGAGYVLAQGDRRGFCVIDQAGGVHSLARRIEGVKTKDVNARLGGVKLAKLPTVDEGRAMQKDPENERRQQAERQKEDELSQLRAAIQWAVADDFHHQGLGPPPEGPQPVSPSMQSTRRTEQEEARDPQADPGADPAPVPGQNQVRDLHADFYAASPPPPALGEERPASRLVDELTRPLGEKYERTMRQAVEEARFDTARQQIRADIDQHLRDQAEKRPQAPETGRGEAKALPARDVALAPAPPSHALPDRQDGPDRRDHDRGDRSAGGMLAKRAGKVLDDFLGILGTLGGLFKGGAGVADAATRSGPASPAPRPEARPAAMPQPQPKVPAPSPTPAQAAPAPRPPSVFDEIQAKIRERAAQGGKAASPARQPEKDRGRGMEFRPSVRLASSFCMDTGWIAEAKRRLIAYSDRTGEAVLEQLAELERIIHCALYGPA